MKYEEAFERVFNASHLYQFKYSDGFRVDTLMEFYECVMKNEDGYDVSSDGDILKDGHVYLKKTNEMNKAGEEDFLIGFASVMPIQYDMNRDMESPTPFCAPWTWNKNERWYVDHLSPRVLGERWGRMMGDEWLYEYKLEQYEAKNN